MKGFLLACSILVLLPAIGSAQDEQSDQYIQGYAFVAPGIAVGDGSAGFLHLGGGGEVSLYKGIGFGGELGYMAPFESMSSGLGVLSVNGLYTFERRGGAKLEPFVTGGYSLIFRSGSVNAMNIGGGANYWFNNKVALRLELRDHFSPSHMDDHLVAGRIGFSFR